MAHLIFVDEDDDDWFDVTALAYDAVRIDASMTPTVVCSDASSSPVISDRENGFVFESRNVQSLVNCIDMVLRERWLADARADRASRCVKESYSERVIVNRIVGMYENELNR